jgi:hypothetical protein
MSTHVGPPAAVHDLVLGLCRGGWAFALGVVLLLVAIPAVDDLDSLLRTLGIASLVLGAVITVATVAGRSSLK